MPQARVSLTDAVNLMRTGDLWLFRGRTAADRAIQTTTNSPVNHVGMVLVIDDLPPLMWHAELGKSLPDVWAGGHHRGVQLHDLRAAVEVWSRRYGQRAWFRQLEPAVRPDQEDAALRTVARLDGTPFPSTARLATRWVRGRAPALPRLPRRKAGISPIGRLSIGSLPLGRRERRERREAIGEREAGVPAPSSPSAERSAERALETAYCAEVVAVTYEAMGLLPSGRRPNWYDPGRFWSGDDLRLTGGFSLGGEIAVDLDEST